MLQRGMPGRVAAMRLVRRPRTSALASVAVAVPLWAACGSSSGGAAKPAAAPAALCQKILADLTNLIAGDRKLVSSNGSDHAGKTAIKKGVAGLVIMTMVTSILLALGTAGGQAAATGTTLTLYSGQHVQTTQALVAAFKKKTGITVNTRYDDEDVFVSQIETEGKNSPADVFFTENSPPLEELEAKGLLSSIAPSTLARTPSRFNSPGGKWVGISARVSVMIYNTSLISASQLPTSVMDLARPKWKGKIALAGAETDFQPIVTTVARTYGDSAALKWLEALKTNATDHIYPDNETIADEVNRGQVALGIINQYYWYRLRAEVGAANMHSKIAYFAPHDVGYVLDVSGAGILRSSTHQAAAQKFVAFLNSAQGQTIIAHSESFEYTIASGVTRTGETPFAQLQPNPVSIAELGTGAEAIKLLQEAQLL